ncbi:MAG: methyltransferase domain-containing protein [Ignavibacteriaceae bacterium]|nr:methyltransferase domain-containing protein [Ignavibacteriaceae bacterium]
MDFKVVEDFTKEKSNLRQSHSKVENGKAISYALMAWSNKFLPKYEVYKKLISYLLSKREKLKILNIGFGGGNLEYLLLKEFGKKIAMVSIDNSKTFYKIARSKNKAFIKTCNLKFYKKDIRSSDIDEREFDLILSRDVNHHLTDLGQGFDKISEYLASDGIMIMEDLRFDAEQKAIKKFTEDIFKIKELSKDTWLLYLKIIGLIESFACSYTKLEVITMLEKYNLQYLFFESPSRYHFILWKNSSERSEKKKILNKFRKCLYGH